MEMWTILAVLVLIAVLAPRYGADSRWPGPGEHPFPRVDDPDTPPPSPIGRVSSPDE